MPRRSRQEAALLSLISEPTIARASEASGISQPTLFRYLQEPDFRTRYHQAKKAALTAALGDLQKASSEAVSTLREIMADPGAGASSRVQAARAVLAFSIQSGELADLSERLQRVEDRLKL